MKPFAERNQLLIGGIGLGLPAAIVLARIERREGQAQQGPDGDEVPEVHPCSEGRCGEAVEQP